MSLFTFLHFPHKVVQTLSLPSGSPDVLSKRVCVSVCVFAPAHAGENLKKNGKDLRIQENLAIKIFNR